jgi:hypothetical protein
VENDEESIDDMKRFEKYVMIAIWCIQDSGGSISKANNEKSDTDDGRSC